LVDTIKAAKSSDSIEHDAAHHGQQQQHHQHLSHGAHGYEDKTSNRRLSGMFSRLRRRESRPEHPTTQTQQLLRGHSRSRSPSPGDNGTPRSGRAVAGGTVYDSEVRYPSYFGHYPGSKPGPYRHLGQLPGDQYQMAHFPTPSTTGHSTYRTPPNSATTTATGGQPTSSRRSRQHQQHSEYHQPSGALFDPDTSSDPPSGYLTTTNTRSARYPSTPRSTYRSQNPEYSDDDDDDDEPSESEPMTNRSSGGNYAPPNSANTRRLPLIGQTMSLGYGGTRSHNDPALTQPPLPQRRPRPMSDNFSSSQPPQSSVPPGQYNTSTTAIRYGHIPPSPSPRSPAELHMYSDSSYPSTIQNTTTQAPSGNYSTHSLPPVAAPYGPSGAPRQPPVYSQARIIHAQPGNVILSDSDTETDAAEIAERWAMV
jgi:hypothetical protein